MKGFAFAAFHNKSGYLRALEARCIYLDGKYASINPCVDRDKGKKAKSLKKLKTVFVKNILPNTPETELLAYFSQFGPINHVSIKKPGIEMFYYCAFLVTHDLSTKNKILRNIDQIYEESGYLVEEIYQNAETIDQSNLQNYSEQSRISPKNDDRKSIYNESRATTKRGPLPTPPLLH